MTKRKQVLVLTNAITEQEVLQIRQAFAKKDRYGDLIKISLVHVIPKLPTCYFNTPSVGALVGKYYDEAKYCLQEVGRHLCVAKNDQWLISGKIRTEVLKLAHKLNADYILANEGQIKEFRSLYFKKIHEYAKAEALLEPNESV